MRRRVLASASVIAACLTACSAQPAPRVTVTASPTPSATATASPSPSITTLKQAYAAVKDGVLRLQSYGCDAGVGTGFAVGANQVVTAAHVVEGGGEVRAIIGTETIRATVVGIDKGRDVALLVLDAPVSTTLTLAPKDAEVGDDVGVIGFTGGRALSLKPGTVNGLDRKANISGTTRYGLIELDSVASGGNSGGPLVAPDGTVVGLLDAGPANDAAGGRLAVPASTIAALVEQWSSRPPETSAVDESCRTAWDPDGDVISLDDAEDPTPEVRSALHALFVYFWAINQADYPTAAAQFAKVPPLDRFEAGVRSSSDRDFEVTGWRMVRGRPQVDMQFYSEQDAGMGPADRPDETCTLWTLRYDFAERDGMWFIDKSSALDGSKNQPCYAGD